jgi:DNA recombination protein RmuC
MESSNEILFLGVGIIVGLIIGGLAIFLFTGKKETGLADDMARQEYEKERIKLQTNLIHAAITIEEKKTLISNIEGRVTDITRALNESVKNLSVADERVQTLAESNNKLNEKTEQQAEELLMVQDNLAQVSAHAKALESNLADQRIQNNVKEVQFHDLTELFTTLKSENATLQANLHASEGKLATQKTEIEDIRRKSHLEFENIANRLLEAKSERFTETNRVNIESLLEPLGKEINSFKARVEETYDKESKERFSLGEKVRELIQTTDKVSAEANNLATALKGQAKTQGNWGEMILERILGSVAIGTESNDLCLNLIFRAFEISNNN